MNDSLDEPPLSKAPHSWARIPALSRFNPFNSGKPGPESTSESDLPQHNVRHNVPDSIGADSSGEKSDGQDNQQQDGRVTDTKEEREEPASIAEEEKEAKLPVSTRFRNDVKHIALSSWINVLLIFVPVGIALGALVKAKGDVAPVSPSVVFAINAIAIIPLASMLSFATESVSIKLGDTVGALLNVTFGNAVELIIFIIALVANQIRIVQASLLGSILANLLLILGMCFVFGGLRFREQLYNSTASQMGAVLLGLAVVSLLLPTAFHASFSNVATADRAVVKVSRGTSVILLIVYALYLIFQLKSHAYMYESTPQHLIDEESHPGFLADMLNSSSDTSSSSDTDSTSSSGSHTTAKRIKRLVRRKRRKSTVSSKDTTCSRPSSSTTNNNSGMSEFPDIESPGETSSNPLEGNDAIFSGDEADVDGEAANAPNMIANSGMTSHDFGNGQTEEHTAHSSKETPKRRANALKKIKRSNRKHKHRKEMVDDKVKVIKDNTGSSLNTGPHVGFVSEVQTIPDTTAGKRPFNMRSLSSAVRPAMPRSIASTVFTHHEAMGRSMPMPTSRPGAARASTTGMRLALSSPDIHKVTSLQPPYPPLTPTQSQSQGPIAEEDIVEAKKHLSQTSAILLLLVSTGLVAICAEFLVDSIDYLVKTGSVSQAFVGLIILPIVGNAAEHVTAVTVATKNKMDLAINVAVGSSIQIALFVTPLIVILGWIIGRDMSLYFSLFETVSLFASTFVVSILLIDGRSNYLEGALLIAAYTIIAVAAFFYPTCDLSAASGPADATSSC